MAKMFYTMDEAIAALGKSEDQIKQYAREGRLREFRDGKRLMYKSDQVEALKNDIASGGASGSAAGGIELAGETGMGLPLVDSSSQPLSLADSGVGSGGAGLAARAAGAGGGSGLSGLANIAGSGLGGSMLSGSGLTNVQLKDETSVGDIGLANTGSGATRAGTLAGSLAGGSIAGSRAGINVFGDDPAEGADPLAQTSVGSASRAGSQMAIDAVGSGSGLLDLTRESDDTSLGAELLDEITPGGRAGDTSAGTFAGGTLAGGTLAGGTLAGGTATGLAGLEPPVRGVAGTRAVAIQQVEAADPLAPAFGWAAGAACLVSLVAASLLMTASLGTQPDLASKLATQTIYILFGGALAVVVIAFIVGLLIGKATTR